MIHKPNENSNYIGIYEKTAFGNILDLEKCPCPFTFVHFLVGFTASHSRFTQEVWLESSDSLISQLNNAWRDTTDSYFHSTWLNSTYVYRGKVISWNINRGPIMRSLRKVFFLFRDNLKQQKLFLWWVDLSKVPSKVLSCRFNGKAVYQV